MIQLSRRQLLHATAGGIAAGSSTLAGCVTAPRQSDRGLSEGFEGSLDDWTTAGHVGPDAFDEFEWSIGRTDERARSGERSLAIFTEGRHDDGTAWITRRVSVDPGTTYRTQGSAYFFSEQESFNTLRHAVLYLGPTAPTTEADFLPPNTNSSTGSTPVGGLREPLDRAAGWNEYRFEYDVAVGDAGELFFAVGTSVVWESDRTDYVDDVALVVAPA